MKSKVKVKGYSRKEYESIFEGMLYPQPTSVQPFWWDEMILNKLEGGELGCWHCWV